MTLGTIIRNSVENTLPAKEENPSFCRNNADLLSVAPTGTNFTDIQIKLQTFFFKQMHFQMSNGTLQHI